MSSDATPPDNNAEVMEKLAFLIQQNAELVKQQAERDKQRAELDKQNAEHLKALNASLASQHGRQQLRAVALKIKSEANSRQFDQQLDLSEALDKAGHSVAIAVEAGTTVDAGECSAIKENLDIAKGIVHDRLWGIFIADAYSWPVAENYLARVDRRPFDGKLDNAALLLAKNEVNATKTRRPSDRDDWSKTPPARDDNKRGPRYNDDYDNVNDEIKKRKSDSSGSSRDRDRSRR